MRSTTSIVVLALALALAMAMAMAMAMGAGAGQAKAELVWRSPATMTAPAGAQGHQHAAAGGGHGAGSTGGHGGHQRRAESLRLLDTDGVSVVLWTPDLKREEVIVAGDTLELPPTGRGNYHAVVAQRESAALHESAIRYAFLHGEPTGRSPSELLAREKVPLEIVPSPVAREHHRYLSDRVARFQVRYRGQPLANAPVSLETSNGSFLMQQADAEGFVALRLPEDFARVRVGRMNNPPADFVVRSRYSDGGREYRTSLSASYQVNPSHWESNRAGFAAAASGFAVGLGILGVAARRNGCHSAGDEA